jgi:hypothetical protein
MRYPAPPPWRRKVVGLLILVALAPLLLSVVVQVVMETFGPLAIFAVVILVLGVVYRVVLGHR